MGTLEDLAGLLHQYGIGILSVDLFAGDLPPTPDAAIALFESPAGDTPLHTHDIPGLALERPEITVLCRAPEYVDARDKAQAIFELVPMLKNELIGTGRYLALWPTTSPHALGRDENNRA